MSAGTKLADLTAEQVAERVYGAGGYGIPDAAAHLTAIRALVAQEGDDHAR